MNERIALFDTKPYDIQAFSKANNAYGFDITYFEPRLSKETASLAKDFPAICLFVHDAVDAHIANTVSELGVKLLALRSNGYNHIDLKATNGKMNVVRVPKYSPYAVAEYAIAMMLCVNRKLHLGYWRTKMNNFSLVGMQGFDMHGKTVGVIGTGQIGAIVVRLLTAFGAKVLAFDQWKNEALANETKCVYTDLETIYKEADIITLHCPLTPETKYMINKESIAKMKDGVMIINTSRGGLIDSQELIEGLKTKKIGAAGLDVYEEEDRFFYEDLSTSFIDDDILARLMTFPNVFVSAHQAFFTTEAMNEIAETTLANINAFFKHQPLQNEITYQPAQK
jgi:D-lactate dehydrogenase